MPRFFVEPGQIAFGKIRITEPDAHHILDVLRLGVGDALTLCDGQGTDYDCVICARSGNGKRDSAPLEAEILSAQPNLAEPDFKVSLFQGLPKSGKMELIIQKTVEMGVHEIIPVLTEYAQAKKSAALSKVDRWQRIAEAAAKQCGRGIIPRVASPLSFEEAIIDAQKLDFSLVAYEKEQNRTLPMALEEKDQRHGEGRARSMGLFIGSEGGFSPIEIQRLAQHQMLSFTLGRRILRAETAGFTALLFVLYERGEFFYGRD